MNDRMIKFKEKIILSLIFLSLKNQKNRQKVMIYLRIIQVNIYFS